MVETEPANTANTSPGHGSSGNGSSGHGGEKPKKRRHPLRLVALGLGGIVVFCLSLLLLFFGALQIPFVQQRAIALAEEAARDAGLDYEIASTGGLWPQTFTFFGVQLSDDIAPFLIAEQVQLSWSPLALFGGTVRVATVSLREGELLRLPQFASAPEEEREETPDRGAPGLPGLPVGIAVQNLAVTEFRIAEQAAEELALGGPLVLSATGQATLQGKVLNADLNGQWAYDPARDGAQGVLPEGAPEDETERAPERGALAVSVLLDQPGEKVALNLALDEPADGVLQQVAGLDAGEALSVEASLQGPFEALALKSLVSGAGLGRLTLGGDLDVVGFETIGLGADYQPGPLLAEAAAPFFGETVSLDLRGGQKAPDKFAFETLAVVSDILSIDGQVGFAFDESEPARWLASPAIAVEADFSVDGADQALEALLPTASEAPPSWLALLDDPLALELAATLDRVANTLGISRAAVSVPTAEVAANANLDLASGEAEGAAALTIPDLAALRAISPSIPEGALSLQIKDVTRTAENALSLRYSLKGEGLASSPALAEQGLDMAGLTGGVVTGAGDLLFSDGALRLDKTRIATDGSRIILEASAANGPDEGLTTQIDGRVEAMNVLLAALPGALEATLDVPVPLFAKVTAAQAGGRLQASVDVTASQAQLSGLPVQDLALEATYTDEAETFGQGALTFLLDGEPQRLSGEMRQQSDSAPIEIRNLSANLFGLLANGAVRFNPQSKLVSGGLEATAADLSSLNPLIALVDPTSEIKAGTLQAKATLAPRENRQGVEVNASLKEVVAVSLEGSPGGSQAANQGGVRGQSLFETQSTSLSLTGRLDPNAVLSPRSEITLEALLEALAFPGHRINELRADLSGPFSALALTLQAEGVEAPVFPATTVTAQAQATADLTGEARTVSVTALDLDLVSHAVSLEGPLALRQNGGLVSVENLQVALEDREAGTKGRLTGAVTSGPGRLEARMESEALPLSAIALVAPDLLFAGTADADVTYTVTRQQAGAALSLSLMDIEPTSPLIAGAKPLTLNVQGGWNGRALSLDGAILGLTERPGTVTAAVPAARAPGAVVPSIAPSAPLQARVDIQGDVADLLGFYPLEDHRLSGPMLIDLAVGGRVSEPSVSGEVRLSDGRYENDAFGTLLTNINLTSLITGAGAPATPSGQSPSLTLDLAARDGEAGTLSGKINLGLDPAASFPVDVALALNRATLTRRDDLTATVSGDVSVSGSMEALGVEGAITVNELEFRLPDTVPGDVVTLPFEIEGQEPDPSATAGGAEPAAPEEEPAAAGPDIDLTLDIAIPNRAFVRGRGLDSEWQGNLQIRGTAASPRILGDLNVMRGTFDFSGRSFDLARGAIGFDGFETVDPRLDIEARTDLEEIEAIIAVTGRASAPIIDFSSEPGRPADTILAQVLFGKDVSELSAFEVVRLASAIRSLQSGGGFDAIGSVRRSLGVDLVEFDLGETTAEGLEDASVRLGKYVTDNVFVGVKRGLRSGENSVSVEVDVTDSLSVETEVDQQSSSSVGFNWEFEY